MKSNPRLVHVQAHGTGKEPSIIDYRIERKDKSEREEKQRTKEARNNELERAVRLRTGNVSSHFVWLKSQPN